MRLSKRQQHCAVLLQAAKEVAHLHTSQSWSTKDLATSTATTSLPIWQEQALMHLNLWGPNANLEITLGGDPPVDPRLLAAVRMLYCKDFDELSVAGGQLGTGAISDWTAWGRYLSPSNEVCPPDS